MTSTLRHIITILSGILLLLGAAACSEADTPLLPEFTRHTTLTLTLHMPQASRGAESHPDEPAFEREQHIDDITVFVYSSPQGLNGVAATPIIYSCYVTSDQMTQNGTSVTVDINGDIPEIGPGDYVAVLANMGDLTGQIRTLGQLQQHIPQSTFSSNGTPASAHHFAMSSAGALEGRIFDHGSTADEIFLGATCSIERIAARIDFNYSNADSITADSHIAYSEMHTVTNPADGSTSTVKSADVYVSHILPINAMRRSSYTLKRISAEASDNFDCFSSWTYTGNPDKDASGHPTAYVVEPHTLFKGTSGLFEQWYDDTAADYILAQRQAYFTADNSIAPLLTPANSASTDEQSLIIDYVNENTQHVVHTFAETLTGLVIRAQYVPAQLHVNEYLENPRTDTRRGTDIWLYRPQNSELHDTDGPLFFADEATAIAYGRLHPSDLAEIKCFPKGECFYNLWITHTVDPDASRVFPMEYGIVRNHIYRVKINFTGIGREGITIDEPDNIKITIMVRDWRMVRHETIIM